MITSHRLCPQPSKWTQPTFNKRSRRPNRHAYLKELFRDGDLKPSGELETYLPFLFDADLYALREHHPSVRMVVFIDQYERCLEQGGSLDLKRFNPFDEMVRDVVSELKGIVFVINGREPLRWNEIDSAWTELLTGTQYKVRGLPLGDANQLLVSEGILDAVLREVMTTNASAPDGPGDLEPVYPLLLDSQVEHWRNSVRSGLYLIPGPYGLRVRVLRIDGRNFFADYCETTNLDCELRLTRYALHRWFDRSLFERVVRCFVTGLQVEAFDSVGNLSFVRVSEDRKRWTLHQGIRESLSAEVTPEVRRWTHLELVSFFEERIEIQSATL